jgi:hypothetical protein
MKKKTVKLATLGLGLAAAVGALGWGATHPEWLGKLGLQSPERVLRGRINGYWTARVDGDLREMARYIHPLQGAVPDPGMLVTESYELEKVQIEGDTAMAVLRVQSRLKHPILSSRQRDTELESRWVRYKGQWYQDVAPIGLNEAIKMYNGEWTPPTEAPVEEPAVQ